MDAIDVYKRQVTHTITTSVISSELAILLCGQKDTVNDVMCGAMLHDLRKIGIPVEILEYPGKLSPQAMNVMRNHVNLTAVSYTQLDVDKRQGKCRPWDCRTCIRTG